MEVLGQRKICLLGSFAVGKTSLVRQAVHSIFDERYHATIGVLIEKKELQLPGGVATLVVWDVCGEDDSKEIRTSFLRGTSGVLLVADGTRPKTIDIAAQHYQLIEQVVGSVPAILLLNKSDLKDEWEYREQQLQESGLQRFPHFLTSAKTGENVEEAFSSLAAQIFTA